MDTWIQWGIGIAFTALLGVVARLDWEIRQLRAWRHKVGEDPCDALSKYVDLNHAEIQRRLVRLENKVFNGVR